MNLSNLTDEDFIREMQHSPLVGRDPLLTEAVTRLENTLDRVEAALTQAQELTDMEGDDDGDDT